MTDLPTPTVPVSWGELLDKLTILEIKRDRIAAPAARANVLREHDALAVVAGPALEVAAVPPLIAELRRVNEALWEIEDAIRDEEAAERFQAEFIRLARAVYRTNDARAAIKRRINEATESALVEEKSYADAGRPPA